MSSTAETKRASDNWTSDIAKDYRLDLLRQLAQDAGILKEFNMLPEVHIKVMDYREYAITLQGLAKIKYIKQIADKLKI